MTDLLRTVDPVWPHNDLESAIVTLPVSQSLSEHSRLK